MLVGVSEADQTLLKKVVISGLNEFVVKKDVQPNYARPRYRILTCGLLMDSPRPLFKNKLDTVDSGYLKHSFFNNFTNYKPAAKVFVFDHREYFNKQLEWNWGQLEDLARY